MTGFHHVEVWTAGLAQARSDWGWLLQGVEFTRESAWDDGESWEIVAHLEAADGR